MKVLLINKFYFQRGGSETVFFTTKKVLEEHHVQVCVFSMKDDLNIPSGYFKYFVENVNFKEMKGFWETLKKAGRFVYSVEAKRKLEKLIQDEKPDIAHVHNFMHQLTPSILSVLKKYKIPVVQTLHDFQMICPNWSLFVECRVCQRCKKRKFYQAFFHRCVHNSFLKSLLAAKELYWQRIFRSYRQKVDLFLAPSIFLKKIHQQWGVKDDIQVLNNPVAVENISPNYEFENYIVCVSRLISGKGVELLIESVKDLDVKLKIVGNGPLLQKIKNKLDKEKIVNVELLGQLEHGPTLEVVKKAKFSVVPSQMYDVYPTTVLESMACGKPVLGAKIGGIVEMITENENGWLFEAGNVEDLKQKIKINYNQKDLFEKLGKQARQTVEKNNSQKKYFEQIIRIYDKYLNIDSQLG